METVFVPLVFKEKIVLKKAAQLTVMDTDPVKMEPVSAIQDILDPSANIDHVKISAASKELVKKMELATVIKATPEMTVLPPTVLITAMETEVA